MANKAQAAWSSAGTTLNFKIKVRDVELFIRCCKIRERYEMTETPSALWFELAEKFQIAKGMGRVSYMSEYCMRKAGIAI